MTKLTNRECAECEYDVNATEEDKIAILRKFADVHGLRNADGSDSDTKAYSVTAGGFISEVFAKNDWDGFQALLKKTEFIIANYVGKKDLRIVGEMAGMVNRMA